MRLYQIVVVAIVSLFTFVASAASTKKVSRIKSLEADTVGVKIVLEETVLDPADDSPRCNDPTAFYIRESAGGNYIQRVSFLVSAFLSGTYITVSYNTCDPEKGYIELSSVRLE